jgi:hypothetical protein
VLVSAVSGVFVFLFKDSLLTSSCRGLVVSEEPLPPSLLGPHLARFLHRRLGLDLLLLPRPLLRRLPPSMMTLPPLRHPRLPPSFRLRLLR